MRLWLPIALALMLCCSACGAATYVANHSLGDLRAEAQAVPNMTVHVRAIPELYIGGTHLSFAAGESPAVSAPGGTDKRIDVLTIDSTGTLAWTTGTPAGSPTQPAIPAGKLPICSIYVKATSTSIVAYNDGVATHGYILTDLRPWLALVDPAAVGAHTILSATHTDTLPDTIVRGDVLVGNATPKLARLALGAANKVLQSDGTDVVWSPYSLTLNADSVLSGTNTGDQTVPATEAGAAHNWLYSYNAATGAFTKSQPAQADISGLTTADSPTFAGLNLGTGNLNTVRGVTFDGAAAGKILQGTADGSDNQWLWLSGGGLDNATRGGHIGLSGNEGQTNYKGTVYILGGSIGTTGTYDGMIVFGPNGSFAWEMDRSGNFVALGSGRVTSASLATVAVANGGTGKTTGGHTISFPLVSPTATSDYVLWKVPAGITISAVDIIVVGGTNWVGGLDIWTSATPPVYSAHVNTSDWTVTPAGGNHTTSFDNAGLTVGQWLAVRTTSVSGAVSAVTVNVTWDWTA